MWSNGQARLSRHRCMMGDIQVCGSHHLFFGPKGGLNVTEWCLCLWNTFCLLWDLLLKTFALSCLLFPECLPPPPTLYPLLLTPLYPSVPLAVIKYFCLLTLLCHKTTFGAHSLTSRDYFRSFILWCTCVRKMQHGKDHLEPWQLKVFVMLSIYRDGN